VPDAKRVYGIRTPVLNMLAKKYKEGGFALVKELWYAGAFEEKLLAAKLLNVICKKNPELSLKLVAAFSKDISNWAECDTIGMQALKPVAKKIQKETFDLSAKLMKSKNLWERRLSPVIIEVYTKDKTLQPEIMKRAGALENDQEYYVKKAVDWIKRNFNKGR
jgi:3-methyladenine DNA glycosylase AlkD